MRIPKRRAASGLGLTFLLLNGVPACGEGDSGDGKNCTPGSVDCVCVDNDTCLDDLVCEEGVCEEPEEVGADGDSGAGIGGGLIDASGGEGNLGGKSNDEDDGLGGESNGGDDGLGGESNGGDDGSGGESNGGGSGGQEIGTGGSDAVDGNMVTNGTFSAALDDWYVSEEIGMVNADGSGGRACMSSTNYAMFLLGWPYSRERFTMERGVSYALSYRAVSTKATRFYVEIGFVSSPFTLYFREAVDLTGDWQTFEHIITLDSTESPGIVFEGTLSGSTTCVDDVVLLELN